MLCGKYGYSSSQVTFKAPIPLTQMPENREEEALGAYLKLLQSKGAGEDSLKRRKQFLLKLIPVIADKPDDGRIYREAVESLIDVMRKSDWAFHLAVAREYFPFWTGDIKAIAALNAEAVFDADPAQWQPLEANLQTLWKLLDKQKFSVAETWPLKNYTLALRQAGAAQTLVDTRVKLVKLLLIRLQDAPEKSHKIYRLTVDATSPLFTMKETRHLFIIVVREFYYFWIGDPDASNYVLTSR
jgi:hypothetical protein